MPIRDLKDQIARLPEQPGVYLYFNAAGRDDLRRQGAGRCATASAAIWAPTARARRPTRCSTRSPPRGHRHRFGRRGAGAREQPDQAARRPKYNILLRDDKNYPYLQLTTSEAFPRVLVARGVERDGNFYAGPFMPAQLRAQDDVADAPAVRHPLVQRGDHRQARPPVPRVRHQALHRAVRRRDLQPRTTTPRPWSTRGCSSRGGTTSWSTTLRDADDRGGRARSGSRRRRSCATRCARSRRCSDRQQKMATTELGRPRRVRR